MLGTILKLVLAANKFSLLFIILLGSRSFAYNCPKNETEWVKLREARVKLIRKNKLEKGIKGTYGLISYCAQKNNGGRIPNSVRNLYRFSRQIWIQETGNGSMGLELSDEEYFNSFPEESMKNLPKELASLSFLKMLDSGREGLDKALKLIDHANTSRKKADKILAFYYESAHLPSIDDSRTMGRLFVYYPEKSFYRFIQFGVPDGKAKKLPESISQIIISKEKPVSVYFNDLWRVRTKNGEIKISTRFKETGRLENCYGCHKSAFVPIVPNQDTFDSEQFMDKLISVNSLMNKFASAKKIGIDTQSYGPPLGRVNPKFRNDVFIQSCSDNNLKNKAERDAIKKAMNCSNCHNGKFMGILNYPSGLTQIEGKTSLAKIYIVDYKLMPPDSHLDERMSLILYKCLLEEYVGNNLHEGELFQWLNERQ